AELDFGQRVIRLLGELDERAVGQRVPADDLRLVHLLVVLAVERDLDLRRAFDDVVVGEDEAGLVDDEARARGDRDFITRLLTAPLAAALTTALTAALAAAAEEAIEEVVAAAAEEVAQLLRALLRLGADVHNGRRD